MFKMLHYSIIALLSILFIASCGTPGSKNARLSAEFDNDANASDEFDGYVENCYNVSPNTIVLAFEPYFFHSTKDSILREGLVWGPKVVYKVESNDSNFVKFKKEYAVALISQFVGADGRNYLSPPFCRIYDAPLKKVNAAIDDLIPVLDNSVRKKHGDKEYRSIEFNIYKRENIDVKWKDKYAINAISTDSGQTIVIVFRDLYISRGSGTFYNRATSDGHNEIWLLNKIGKSLH